MLAKRIRHTNGAIPPASQRLFATNIFNLQCCNHLNTKRIVNRFIVKHFISKLIYCWPSSGSFDRETRSLLQQTGSADEVYQLMARLVTFTNQGSWSSKCSSGVAVVYVGLALLHLLGGVVYGVSQHLFRVNKCFHVGKNRY